MSSLRRSIDFGAVVVTCDLPMQTKIVYRSKALFWHKYELFGDEELFSVKILGSAIKLFAFALLTLNTVHEALLLSRLTGRATIPTLYNDEVNIRKFKHKGTH